MAQAALCMQQLPTGRRLQAGGREGRQGLLEQRRRRLEASLDRRRQRRSELQAALCAEEQQRPCGASASSSGAKEASPDAAGAWQARLAAVAKDADRAAAGVWQARLAALAEDLRQKREKVAALRERELQLEAELRNKLYEERGLIPSLHAAAAELRGAFRSLALGAGGPRHRPHAPAAGEARHPPCGLLAATDSALTSQQSLRDACSSDADLQPRALFASNSNPGSRDDADKAPGMTPDSSGDSAASPSWQRQRRATSSASSQSGERSPSSQSCQIADPSDAEPKSRPSRCFLSAALPAARGAPPAAAAAPPTGAGAGDAVASAKRAGGFNLLPPPRASLAAAPGPLMPGGRALVLVGATAPTAGPLAPADPSAPPAGLTPLPLGPAAQAPGPPRPLQGGGPAPSPPGAAGPAAAGPPVPPEVALPGLEVLRRASSARQLRPLLCDEVPSALASLPGSATPPRHSVAVPATPPGAAAPPPARLSVAAPPLLSGGRTPPQPCGSRTPPHPDGSALPQHGFHAPLQAPGAFMPQQPRGSAAPRASSWASPAAPGAPPPQHGAGLPVQFGGFAPPAFAAPAPAPAGSLDPERSDTRSRGILAPSVPGRHALQLPGSRTPPLPSDFPHPAAARHTQAPFVGFVSAASQASAQERHGSNSASVAGFGAPWWT
uniref:Uncharacterized protein n=1 Tax=Alexandrium monilatum TaxID=311494 RepID=A0A7S4UW51_9DINO